MSNNITSIVNSTTAIITAGSNFTGKAEDISNYNTIVAHVIADQDVLIEIFQSEDGTNWDIYSNGTASATSIKVLLVPAQAKYCYVKITNNTASDTTYCRLQTIFKESCQSVFLDSSIQNLVLNTRAIKDTEDGILCFGYDGSSNQKIKTSNGGLIRNLPEYNIQSFLLNNQRNSYTKNLHLVSGSASGDRILQSGLTSLTTIPANPGDCRFRIVSSDGGDTAQMRLNGVNYDNTPHGTAFTLDMTLNGTTNVDTVFYFMCMVNNVYPVNPNVYPTGELIVSMDIVGDNSFSFVLGKFTKGKWQSSLHLVPNARKLAVTRMFSNNQLDSSESHIHTLNYIQNYTTSNNTGVTPAISLAHPINIVSNIECIGSNPIVFDAGTFVFVNSYTSSACQTSCDLQMIEYDV